MVIPITDNSAVQVAERLAAFDQALSQRLRLGKKELLRMLLKLGVRQRVRVGEEVALRASLRYFTRSRDGNIERVGFRFERHGIFLAHGVGRGRPVRSKKANDHKKDWLTPVLDVLLDDIADLVAEGYADIIAAEFKLNIPGIIFKVVPDKTL